ncbi:hypothetical protein MHU86_2519 [Fragilaria crotonensis]|nr:hypothetical protein MHU86_11998 [Fragilaria crotonensis]KAI2511787.1 hypothetical protein MHU86_2519 [Fragilaria crotonensis]
MLSLARQLTSKSTRFSVVARALSSSAVADAPSIRDNIVSLTFVDPSGARRKVPAMVGDTIWEVAELHKIDLGPASVGAPFEAVRSAEWTEPLFGEGPTSGFDHVLLAGKGADTAPPRNEQELRMLQHYWDYDEIFPESRLACVIPVNKAMDGMIVYVPDRIVDDIP